MSRSLADVPTAAVPKRGGGPRESRSVPALTVISHPLSRRVGERLLLDAVTAGRQVALSRNGPDFTPPGSALGQPLLDPFVSRKPLHLGPGAKPGVVCVDKEIDVDPKGDGKKFRPPPNGYSARTAS